MYFKPFEELTFSDDFMFGKVMQDPEICTGVLERLLHIKIDHIEYPELQKIISPYYTSRGIRLDVYVKDSDRVFDIEMQSTPQDALEKRMRYYQSMLDIDDLIRGSNYDELKESYVIFICKTSPFKKDSPDWNHPVYKFETMCRDYPDVIFNDSACKLIYNASAYKTEKDPELRALLNFVCKNNADDNFTRKITSLIDKIKQNEINKTEYMSMNIHEYDKFRAGKKEGIAEGMAEGIKKGIKQGTLAGAQQKAEETAKKLIKMKLGSIEQIAEAINLPVEQVEALADEIRKD